MKDLAETSVVALLVLTTVLLLRGMTWSSLILQAKTGTF